MYIYNEDKWPRNPRQHFENLMVFGHGSETLMEERSGEKSLRMAATCATCWMRVIVLLYYIMKLFKIYVHCSGFIHDIFSII